MSPKCLVSLSAVSSHSQPSRIILSSDFNFWTPRTLEDRKFENGTEVWLYHEHYETRVQYSKICNTIVWYMSMAVIESPRKI